MTLSLTPRTRRASRHRASSAARLVIAAALLAPALAACAPDPEASSGSSSPTAVSGSTTALLGSCLRDAGFDVDDAQLAMEGVVAAPTGTDVEAFTDALSACRDELPAEQRGGDDEPTAADLAELQEANLAVAECVREKGFDDFPDPVDGGFPREIASGSTDPGARDARTEAFFACSDEVGPNSEGRSE
jgi:hypothetical protein